ncbi:MAG: HAD hydrolase family protein [Lachnospiraceae bacterium]|nr:HAD hydrolase family protein [Lachnospiraceae bacterium]
MLKKYKAIFFDWDGTAVLSRRAPVTDAAEAMKPLLRQGIKLVIVSGTTIENIAQGKLEELFEKEELANLYLGLGRGAYNYAFDDGGKAYIFQDEIPDKEKLLQIHRICFEIHQRLLEQYDYETDIVFSRPNYCKIDLMVKESRGANLFMQANELDMLKETMRGCGLDGGLQEMIGLAKEAGRRFQVDVVPTCDAKYLEVGISSKSDNVNAILQKLENDFGIRAEDCAFWGDEYVGIEPGIFGSDSFMKTNRTENGDFFDVSEVPGDRPERVTVVGGGVERFLDFLRRQAEVS